MMKVSTKELRIQPGRIIDQVVHGEEVTVTFRGKALAKIVPILKEKFQLDRKHEGIFGMWIDRIKGPTVDALVREMRNERRF